MPGHEKFVRQMIAGATGIDLLVLVVAADEGVMPQTREHLDICRLLGVKRGLIVLSKVDLVDEEWLELVESDLEDFVADTFLEGAPVVHFSAVDKSTWDGARAAIEARVEALRDLGRIKDDEPLRLPVDRAFTMKGFGTVVTGTVCSGHLRENEHVVILPHEIDARVRGIQCHSEATKRVGTGQRAAVNLLNIDLDHVHRGDVVTRRGELRATRMLDVDLELLAHVPAPLQSQAKALVHVGTSQAVGTIVLLDRDELEPGSTCPVQLRLDRFVVALGSDHVVLRGFEALSTHGKTLGGGQIRHPLPRKHKANRPRVLEAFEALRSDDLAAACRQAVHLTAHMGATPAELRQVLSAGVDRLKALTDALIEEKVLYSWSASGVTRFIHREVFQELIDKAVALLDGYHEKHPHRSGMPKEELLSQIRSDLPPRYFAAVVQELVARDLVVDAGMRVRRQGFEARLSPELEALSERLYRLFFDARLEPPFPEDARQGLLDEGISGDDIDEMIVHLIGQGRLQRVVKKLIFATEHIERLEADVVKFLEQHGEMTTPQLKEITGTTRKYTVPLGEHMDARMITIRSGDVRKLRR